MALELSGREAGSGLLSGFPELLPPPGLGNCHSLCTYYSLGLAGSVHRSALSHLPVSAQRAQPLSCLADTGTSYSLPPLLLPRILFLLLPLLLGQEVKGRTGRVVPGILLIHEALLEAEKREHIVWCSFKVLPGLRIGQETKSKEAWLSSSTAQPESHPLETGGWSRSAHRHYPHNVATGMGSGFKQHLSLLPCCVSLSECLNLSVPTSTSGKWG